MSTRVTLSLGTGRNSFTYVPLVGDCSSYSIGSSCCRPEIAPLLVELFLSYYLGHEEEEECTNKFVFTHRPDHFKGNKYNYTAFYMAFEAVAEKVHINKVKGWTGDDFEVRVLEVSKNAAARERVRASKDIAPPDMSSLQNGRFCVGDFGTTVSELLRGEGW